VPQDLPIPEKLLHYGDPKQNVQSIPIEASIDHLQYPTLGCPELLRHGEPFTALLSLPTTVNAQSIKLALIDRHGMGDRQPLASSGVAACGDERDGREIYRITCNVDQIREGFYDIEATWDGGAEVQLNAVRIYDKLANRIVICGDSQYNVKNTVCLENFIERMSYVDADWIVMIGDVCDNGVKSYTNVACLAIEAPDAHVQCYYNKEYPGAHALLAKLDKPVFLVPGNHDGMVAYANNEVGQSTVEDKTVVGKDPKNEVAYDGLQHYRRTFGPTHYAFDWGNTRYFCLNTFELFRHDRLGFHCIVTNWGGCMQEDQLSWLKDQLEAAAGMHKVVFMHHDPRGGDKGNNLGQLHAYRPYNLETTTDVIITYLNYFMDHKSFSQQEWMARKGENLDEHHLRRLAELLRDHKVESVFMGHDNKNWIDTHEQGENLFVRSEEPLAFDPLDEGQPPVEQQIRLDKQVVAAITTALEHDTLRETVAELKKLDPTLQNVDLLDEALRRGVQRYLEDEVGAYDFVDGNAASWDIRAEAAIHFVHVDDVGAYKHRWPWHFKNYGYVLAELDDGRPYEVTSFRMNGQAGKTEKLFHV
jgi:3',5'-cyclic AMP phosphodiesterase CpdA